VWTPLPASCEMPRMYASPLPSLILATALPPQSAPFTGLIVMESFFPAKSPPSPLFIRQSIHVFSRIVAYSLPGIASNCSVFLEKVRRSRDHHFEKINSPTDARGLNGNRARWLCQLAGVLFTFNSAASGCCAGDPADSSRIQLPDRRPSIGDA